MRKLFLSAVCAILAVGMNAQTTYLEYCNAGDECFSNADYKGAIENYIKALELDTEKSDYTTAMQLGSCYEQIEEWQKAGDAFKEYARQLRCRRYQQHAALLRDGRLHRLPQERL